ncbi:MAG: hypothetical protein NTX75_03580 [Proteobacteria bacterium]|nr:hypothetical protein [Pseudomonadota bacterium]
MDERDQIELSSDNMVKIYEIFRKNLLASMNLHRQHAQHYLTFIAVVTAATIAGFVAMLNANSSKTCFLVVGPIFNVYLSVLAICMCNRYYKGFLEEVSVTAKIEELIGLSTPHSQRQNSCFKEDETIVPSRWIKGRERFKNSADFVKDNMNRGSNKVLHFTFVGLIIVNIVMAVLIVFLF